jgi:nucleoside phosphorylase
VAFDWGATVPDVVDGWLFSEPGPLPGTLVVPLENPHLHDDAAWLDVFGTPTGTNGLVATHAVDGVVVGVAKPVLGAAATAMLVDAAARRGVHTVLGIGFCGGTDPTLTCGDVIVAASAYGDDGVSAAYDPTGRSAEADSALLELVGNAARRGPVRTVAAVHLETQRLVDECAAAGVLGIDMETAALYTVAGVRGMSPLAVLTVSDVPARGAAADGTTLGPGYRRALRLGRAIAVAGSTRTRSGR